jgi:hypothetical protein
LRITASGEVDVAFEASFEFGLEPLFPSRRAARSRNGIAKPSSSVVYVSAAAVASVSGRSSSSRG